MLSCRLKRPRHPAAAGHSPVACSPRSSAAPSRQQIADPPRAELALFVPSIPNKFLCAWCLFLFFSISYRLVPSAFLFLFFFSSSSSPPLSSLFRPSCFFPSSSPPSSALYLLPSHIPLPPPSPRHLLFSSPQVANQVLLFDRSRRVVWVPIPV